MATHILLCAPYPAKQIVCHRSVRVAAGDKQRILSNATINSQLPYNTSPRRSADYKPSIWNFNYLQSLKTNFSVEKYKRRTEKLKEDVKMVLQNVADHPELDHFELIDDLQRLGLAYHFEEEINTLLEYLYNIKGNQKDLYATALEFRLFSQHGHHISQDTFKRFVDDKGCFKGTLRTDVRGMLSMHEASYFSFEGENIMKEAFHFTAEALTDLIGKVDENLSSELIKTLELPLRWRSPRLEVRRFIDVYEKKVGMNPLLLELAKLDFNLLQGLYLEELQNQSRWWKNIGLGEKLDFARDRLVESFLWSVGISFEPQFELRRTRLTRAIALITVIDDIYDVYGTLAELELLTDAIQRWDINEIKQLPNYMKICFIALYNFVNEIVYDILKEQDLDILPYLKKAWFELVKSYLVEARWYNSGHKPTFDEYMKNGWISITTPLVVLQAYVGAREPIEIEALEFLSSEPDILYWAGFIFRLADDCGTSTDELKRGDVPKSIQCYMNETGVSEEVAQQHMMDLMRTAWKKVNKCRVADSPLPRSFVETMLNLVRTSHCLYHNGDGHGVQDGQSIDRVSALLFQPIPL